jgi:transposase
VRRTRFRFWVIFEPIQPVPMPVHLCFALNADVRLPARSNRNEPICFSSYLYRARNLVERLFDEVKQFRRVATLR